MAVDAERVGQGERHLAAGAPGRRDRLGEGFVAFRPVEAVAFEEDPLGVGHHRRVDIRRREMFGDAEIRVHRALAIGGDQHDAAPGFVLVAPVGQRHFVGDALGAQIVGEDPAQLVVLDLSDIGRPPAEMGKTRDGVGGRAA